jgi:hypothetical protein
VDRDERTIAVENASYRWAYMFMSFGLLLLVGYRSFVHHESSWDLFALVILGGGVGEGQHCSPSANARCGTVLTRSGTSQWGSNRIDSHRNSPHCR